jgi:hypothetical protein
MRVSRVECARHHNTRKWSVRYRRQEDASVHRCDRRPVVRQCYCYHLICPCDSERRIAVVDNSDMG